MYQPPEWFDRDEADEMLGFFGFELGTSPMEIYQAAGALGVAERAGMIPDKELNIVEFGSGLGHGLIALNMLAKARGVKSTVTGSERTPSDWNVARQVSEYLDRVQGVETDGITALRSQDSNVDLVLANMFGPSYHDERRPAEFIPVALGAISPAGAVVINSDADTMGNVVSWARRELAESQVTVIKSELLPSGFMVTPHVILTKNN
jgi:hypothetical protein